MRPCDEESWIHDRETGQWRYVYRGKRATLALVKDATWVGPHVLSHDDRYVLALDGVDAPGDPLPLQDGINAGFTALGRIITSADRRQAVADARNALVAPRYYLDNLSSRRTSGAVIDAQQGLDRVLDILDRLWDAP